MILWQFLQDMFLKLVKEHMALTAKQTTKCPNCGAIVKSHRVCKECGYYKGKKVVKETEE